MTRSRRAPIPPAALAPVLIGASLFAPAAAEARRGEIDGRRMKPSEKAETAADALAMGRFFLKAGEPVKALAQYRQALGMDPASIEALNGMAVSYDRLGRYDVARSFYEAALGLAPEEPMLLNNYGYSLFLQGDHEGAARYLGMAVASGDPDVQAASLSVLAKIDAARARVRAAVPSPPPAPIAEGPRVVRTSSYEQRLVLGGAKPAPAAVAALGEAAVAVVEVASLSEREERHIALTEAALVAAETRAAAAREAEVALAAAPAPEWPEAMRRALELDARFAPGLDAAAVTTFDGFGGAAPDDAELPLPYLLEARRPAPRENVGRRDMRIALLATGVAVQRKAERPGTTKELPPAEPQTQRRSFDNAFDSDDSRLNQFAARVQGLDDDVAAKVARLEALIGRLGSA